MRKATGRLFFIGANLAGDEFSKGDFVAQCIDQFCRQRQLAKVALCPLNRISGIGQQLIQLRLRAGFGDVSFPLAPHLIIHALDRHFRFRRLVRPHKGFDGAFERAHAIDIGLYPQLVEQSLIIRLRSPWACQ